MLGFPKNTEFNKRIPKQKFYENLTVTPSLRNAIKEQIKTIVWRNKIAATTMNLAKGEDVTEIEVFEVKLTGKVIDETVLRQMDKEIPYHILFLLEYDEKYQAWIGYKEKSASGNNAFKVSNYYHTEWLPENEIPIRIDGLNLDAVYEGFVRQIAGDKLQKEENETLEESVSRAEEKEKLWKQIEMLKKKMKNEKQLNRQMEINAEIKNLNRKMEDLS